ncbi:response regulator, partial [bacterium]|nr:response regulator [bacterium]
SKLEADQMKIEPAPIDFRELGEEVMKVFQYRAGEQQIELRVEMPPLPEMELDKLRVRQVLFNLIGNAVKFTCEGSVTLKAEYQPDHDGTCEFTFLVIDTGPGIAPEDQARLMEPFVQLSRIRGAAAGNSGTGLGLTISRRLIEKMGGTLWLKSEPGWGSVFGATLRHIRISKERKPAEPSEDKAPACGRASALSILIVDDVAMNLKVMKALCRKAGIEKIETALSGKEALTLLEAHSFDLVLTDMWMPEMNGAALAGKIRADRRFQEMPILAVTADVEARDNFPLEFFNGVLLKPVTLEKIRKMLGSVQGMGV